MMRTRIHGLGFIGGRLASIRLPRGCVDCRLQPQVDQKSRNETLVLRESPLPLRAIPNCQMDGSPPPPPPVLPPSMAEPLAPLSSPSRGDELRPRGDSPRKSRLYCHQQSMEVGRERKKGTELVTERHLAADAVRQLPVLGSTCSGRLPGKAQRK